MHYEIRVIRQKELHISAERHWQSSWTHYYNVGNPGNTNAHADANLYRRRFICGNNKLKTIFLYFVMHDKKIDH